MSLLLARVFLSGDRALALRLPMPCTILGRRLRSLGTPPRLARPAEIDDLTHQAGTIMCITRRASLAVTGVSATTSPSIEIGSGGSVAMRNSRPLNSRTVPRT